jgi:hypothetical protein
LIVEPITPIPQPSRSSAGHRVVAGGDHHRDDQEVEREALLGHPVGRPAEGEDGHQDRDHQLLAAAQPLDDPADPRLDRAGLHRDGEEAADHEDEQGDVDRPEEEPGVVVGDVAVGVLDAVQAVDRRGQRVADDPGRVLFDSVIRARDRRAVRVPVVDARRDDPGQDRDEDDQDEQDRVGGWEAESALLRALGRFGRRRRCGHAWAPPGSGSGLAAAIDSSVAAGPVSPDPWIRSMWNPVSP